MNRFLAALALLSSLYTVAGCASHSGTACCAGDSQPSATASNQAPLLDKVKALAGTWEMTDEHGQKQTAAVFTVSSSGTAVREVMFPGTPHEMTNMYTMDGSSLLMTHYCAIGNQPHMKAAAAKSSPDRIELKCDSVTNKSSSGQMYMGDLTIVFKDANHITEQWQSYQNGKPTDHNPGFELTRKN